MKKTIIINIGNSIIHIEEEAYDILSSYLLEIKQHFAKNADDFEIVSDIENRIAEMFAEILEQNNKQIVEMADVQQVIAQMGSVKDFQIADEEANAQPNSFTNFLGDKKLYRDSDDAVVAGVCTGLGHYLNVEARWIRLIAFLSVFLGGAGVLAYLIVWIVVPKAITRSEKMQMKGEATNLFGYKKSFDEELVAFKQKMKSANDQHFQPIIKYTGNFITEFFGVFGRLLTGAVKIIGKIIAGILIAFGFSMLVTLLIGLVAFMGFWGSNLQDYFPFCIVNPNSRIMIVISGFVVFFVPILALVLFAIRVAFNKMTINKTVSFSLLIVWMLGVSSMVYHVTKIASEFNEHAELVKSSELITYPTYLLEVDKNINFSHEDSLALQLDSTNNQTKIVIDKDYSHPFRIPKNVRLKIEKSDNDKTTISQTFEAEGKTFPIALRNAQNINYRYSQKDSVLIFDPKLKLKQQASWRSQEVAISLKVPVGTRFKISKDFRYYLKFYYDYCDEHNENINYTEWMMTEDGLKCKTELDALNP
jgi:phage shock protein PspC (stress-responsive transcriptional regulator)